MSLCAAAIAEAESWIATISDTMIGGSTISSDGCTVKMHPFARDWVAMFSGSDLTPCIPIIQLAEQYLSGRANTLRNVRTIFKKAFQQYFEVERADKVLSVYGLSMKTFKSSGRKMFTAEVFKSICEKMESFTSDLEFLVYGFDGTGRPHLFTVFYPGCDAVYDKPGFAAIGCGKYAADTMLHYFGQSINSAMERTVFNLCAGKFLAERTAGVGLDTFLYFKRPGTVASTWKGDLIGDLRKVWDTDCGPKVSLNVIALIREFNIRCI
jgi:hypothetical protein